MVADQGSQLGVGLEARLEIDELLESPLDDSRLHDVPERLPSASSAIRGPTIGHSPAPWRRHRLQVDAVVVDAVDRGEGLVHAAREPAEITL